MIVEASHDGALWSRIGSLNSLRTGVRYVDYTQAERDCERLAARILDVYPPEELISWRFIPIPRGGMIVLGILSYFLDLDPEQLEPGKDGPVVVVDDIALTGARFSRTIATFDAPRVVFAHLYSHPDLRAAIGSAEPRVERCLSAHDLEDHSEETHPDPGRRREWRQWWLDRLGPGRYWFGQPELVAFPWSEPHSPVWNADREEIELGWHLVPPHRCLGNRAYLGVPPRPDTNRRWIVPDDVAIGVFDGAVYAAQRPTGDVYGFQGVAGDMFRALAVYGDPRVVVDHLLALYDVEGTALADDVDDFVDELVGQGLLIEVDHPSER